MVTQSLGEERVQSEAHLTTKDSWQKKYRVAKCKAGVLRKSVAAQPVDLPWAKSSAVCCKMDEEDSLNLYVVLFLCIH